MGPLLALAGALDALSRAIGLTLRWLAILLVLVQFGVVVLRYAFGSSFIAMQEGVLYLHAALFMLTIGYAYLVDQHVRVDALSAGWTERGRASAELLCVLLAVLPFCALILWASWGWVAVSFRLGEGPMQVGGLPFQPWLKGLIPAMAVLLALQSVSVAIRAAAVLSGRGGPLFPARRTMAG